MPKLDSYEQAIDYLDSLSSLEVRPDDPKLRHMMRLERMRDMLAVACAGVGDPYSLRAVHVAGTKGKGSVVALMTAMLTEANFRVGSFVSPHIMSVEERICIGGRSLSRGRFSKLLSETTIEIEKSCKIKPTYFELLTTCAVRVFLEEKVDIAVLEIGLGGRLDCTNVLPNIACAITNISIDHTELLGNDVVSIAKEKAGVIKGAPVVCARQKPEVLDVIRAVCKEKGSPLLTVGEDIKLGRREVSPEGQKVSVNTWKRDFHDLGLPLRGARQHENLGVALGMIEVLGEREGFEVQSKKVRRALRSVRIPARMEFFPGKPAFIIDGAHNEASVENFVHHIRHDVKPSRTVVIFGMARDKEVAVCLDMLCPISDLIVLTEIGSPRSASVDELKAMLPEDFPDDRVRADADAVVAYKLALDEAGPDDLVVCLGSFYLAGAVRTLVLGRQCQEDADS